MHGRIGNWKTRVDVFSLENLIAWLEKQPEDGTYDYGDSTACMATQALRAAGIDEERYVGHAGFFLDDEFFEGFWDIARGDCSDKTTWTFGAALTRARAALKDSTP